MLLSPTESTRLWNPIILDELHDIGTSGAVDIAKHQSSLKGFSPVDAFVFVLFPSFGANGFSYTPKYLGTLMLFSISSHRDKFPVAVLGRIAPVGYTAGHRTVAGSMGFHIFDHSLLEQMAWSYARMGGFSRPLRFDEFPPFDMNVVFVSEEGAVSYLALRGVTILDDGTTLQIDDPTVRTVLSYMALDVEPMLGVDSIAFSPNAPDGPTGPVRDAPSDPVMRSLYPDFSQPAVGNPGELLDDYTPGQHGGF